ncbi:MAG: Non-heme chloroperoxidase [Accumulibacter sp.]|uniref:alpha/beta hydrolase n=2 Tax=Accumulibacter sp. TaxID=2053492 RepID=UPI00122A9A60|nr:alpha/beta fold hydrolase [Accumulibacter sp.]TLD44956.1 MAG: Non-heme chloroperoxidase [Accumulibacter sp.]
MARRTIHLLRHATATPSRWPPLLFLHGGYVDSRCWLPNFLPYFASRGYDCHAADLPGHGRSEGRECLDRLGLDDYLADITPVVEGLDSRPVVIGHSMGALLAERLLERSLAEAAVLISPVPPNGTLESSLSLFLRHPEFIGAVARMSSGVFDDDGMRLLRDVYFTPATDPDELQRLVRIVQPESARAIADMAMLGWRWPLPPRRRPVLVLGGELDVVFPPHQVRRVARRWQADLQIIPAAGHAMILDHHWQSCAARILGWLHQTRSAAPMAATDGGRTGMAAR